MRKVDLNVRLIYPRALLGEGATLAAGIFTCSCSVVQHSNLPISQQGGNKERKKKK